MWLIAGLGNPGLRYKWSRHNIGFQLIDLIGKNCSINLKKNRFTPAQTGKGHFAGEEVILVKPLTYMNRSGSALCAAQKQFNIPNDKVIVAIDDIDLPWFSLRIRAKGSSGGHKGLQSVINGLSSNNFPRLRMGIGRGVHAGNSVSEYVLNNFNKAEKKDLLKFLNTAMDAIDSIMREGIEKAMNRFN